MPRRFAVGLAVVAGSCLFAAVSFGTGSQDVRWRSLVNVPGVVDVAGPRSDGRLVISSHQGLFLLRPDGRLAPFARGSDGYAGAPGEPYVAVASRKRLPRAGCSFRRDDLYVLDPSAARPGIVLVDRSGKARRFLDLPGGAFPSTVAFDTVGRFGHRLLVTAVIGGRTTLYAINCRGRTVKLVRNGPKVEGGAMVAPLGFGRFAASSSSPTSSAEMSTRSAPPVAYARSPTRRSRPAAISVSRASASSLAASRAAARRTWRTSALPARRRMASDSVLTLGGRALLHAGVRPGDLLVASEGGGVTVSVRCRASCVVRRIGRALDATHGEGHIAFTRG